MEKSKLEELLQEMVRSGIGHQIAPKKLMVSPTMFRAAEMILEARKSNSHEIKVNFDE